MELVIDKLDTTTGWTSSDITKATIYGLNGIKQYIANYNTSSLILQFLTGCQNAYVQKTFTSIDVSKYETLVLSVYSRNYPYYGSSENLLNSFVYSLQINDVDVPYTIQLYKDMIDLSFDISQVATINKLKITALTNNADYLIISNATVYKNDIPLDIFTSFKTYITNELNNSVGSSYVVTTSLTCLQNDTQILLGNSGLPFVEKYAIIKITDGINTEYHQLFDNDESYFGFTGLYDGNKILHNYTNATVSLYFPVEYGKRQSEIILPGISIYGFIGKPILRNTKVQTIRDSYRINETVEERQDDQIYEWEIMIDCEARHDELLMLLSQAVRNVIARETIWITGRRFEMFFKNDPIYLECVESYNEIPKVQYSVRIEVQEEIWSKTILPKTVGINDNIVIRSN